MSFSEKEINTGILLLPIISVIIYFAVMFSNWNFAEAHNVKLVWGVIWVLDIGALVWFIVKSKRISSTFTSVMSIVNTLLFLVCAAMVFMGK